MRKTCLLLLADPRHARLRDVQLAHAERLVVYVDRRAGLGVLDAVLRGTEASEHHHRYLGRRPRLAKLSNESTPQALNDVRTNLVFWCGVLCRAGIFIAKSPKRRMRVVYKQSSVADPSGRNRFAEYIAAVYSVCGIHQCHYPNNLHCQIHLVELNLAWMIDAATERNVFSGLKIIHVKPAFCNR